MISNTTIEENIQAFLSLRTANHRYSSFDYCYNYFHKVQNKSIYSDSKNMELSCLHLGFYLASWGMLRMSGFLGTTKSVKFFEKAIYMISESTNDRIWEIDVPFYKFKDDIVHLVDWYSKLEEVLCHFDSTIHRKPTKILVTKVMLGIFGCTPALDNNFTTGMGLFGKFNETTLKRIYDFYIEHKDIINRYSDKTRTIDYLTLKHTKLKYSKAKIIDMIGFLEGYK